MPAAGVLAGTLENDANEIRASLARAEGPSASILRGEEISFRTLVTVLQSKIRDMKKNKLLIIGVVGAGLTIAGVAQAHERKHEEQSINQSDVPAAVQQAAQTEAKGGTIVRWEKEGANFEAVIQKNGKEIGIEMDANGKVLSKHNEAKEHQHEGTKY